MVIVVPFAVGSRVRVMATDAPGTIVEVSRRFRTADVDLGDGITAELDWDDLELLPAEGKDPALMS